VGFGDFAAPRILINGVQLHATEYLSIWIKTKREGVNWFLVLKLIL